MRFDRLHADVDPDERVATHEQQEVMWHSRSRTFNEPPVWS
jgi:hypothetical protein